MEFIKKIVNDVPVTLIKTNKFKSVYVSIYFKSLASKENVTYRSVLKNILIESCMKYKKSEDLYIKLLDCYDAYLSSSSSRYGNYIINSFNTSVLLDKYTTNNNFDKVIDIFCEVIFNPYVKDNMFDIDTFNMVVSRRKAELEKTLEESYLLSEYETYKSLNQNKAYTYLSELKYLEKLTPNMLYEEYINMINNSEISLIICGNIDDDNIIINKITNNIKNNITYDTPLIINNDDDKINFNNIVKNGVGTQNILDIVLYIKDYTDYELNFVAPIYRVILGGMDSSRLFINIREKNSLSYYVFARLHKDDSMINVIMGIEKENYNKALNLSLEMIESMNKISKKELEHAKKEIISSLLESQDDISNVVSRCYNAALYNMPSIDEFINILNSVTKEEVEKFSHKVKPAISHFLKGDDINE